MGFKNAANMREVPLSCQVFILQYKILTFTQKSRITARLADDAANHIARIVLGNPVYKAFSRRPGSAEMPSAARPFTTRVVEDLEENGIIATEKSDANALSELCSRRSKSLS